MRAVKYQVTYKTSAGTSVCVGEKNVTINKLQLIPRTSDIVQFDLSSILRKFTKLFISVIIV